MPLSRTTCGLALCSALTFLLTALPALAQTKVFNGSVNGNWNTATNWTPAGVPGPTDTVSVPAGSPALVIDNDVNVASLQIARSTTFSGARTVTTPSASITAGTFRLGSNSTLSGGTWTVDPAATFTFDSSCSNRLANLTINGTLLFDSSTSRTRWNNVTVNGAITVSGGCNPVIAFEGNQTLNVSGGITVDTSCTMVFEQQTAGTLTIPAGLTISGGNITLGGSNCHGLAMTLVNNGTISIGVDNRTLTLAPAGGTTNNGTIAATGAANLAINTAFTNAASGSVSTAAGTFTLNATDLTNLGAITTTNTTVNLGGTFNPAALQTINRTGGVVNVTGTADLAGGSFTLNNATGTWVLNGGTFQNGTLTFADAQRLALSSSCSNRLADLTINGTLLFDSGTSRTRWNNVTVNGAITVSGGCNPSIGFEGNQTLNVSGGVSVDTSCTMVFEQQTAGTLTIPAGLTISGGNITLGGSNCHGLAMTLVNNGTISIGVDNRTLTLAPAGGTTNNGTIAATGAANLAINTAFTNAASGSVSTAAGTFTLNATDLTNLGAITTTNTTVNLGGTFNPAALQTINRTGGVVNVTGTADLAGGSFTLNNATGTWVLNGGTFQNGTLTFADAQRLALSSSCSNRLANLTINGTLLFDGSAPRVRWNNVAVNGALSVTATGCNPSIGFEGNQTLNVSGGVSVDTSCTMVFEQQTAGTLTIPAGLTISGGNITLGGSNCHGLAMTLVNNGTISIGVDNRTLTLAPAGGTTNNGTIAATGAANLAINTAFTNAASGSVSTAAGTFTLNATGLTNLGAITTTNTTVNLGGTFNPAALQTINRTGGVVNVTGTADLAGGSFTLNNATGTWVLNGGTFQNGTVNFTDGQRLALSSNCSNRLADLTINGTLLFDSGTSRTRWNNVTVNGAITVSGGCNPSIAFEGNQTLNVSGGVSVDTSCTMVFEQQTPGTLTIPAGLTIAGGNINLGGANCFGLAMTLVNNGTISIGVDNRTLTLAPAGGTTNNGTIAATGTTNLAINTAFTNNGTIAATGAANLAINTAFTNAASGSVSTAAGTFTLNATGLTNLGAITTTNTTVNLGGTFNPAALLTINRTGGVVNVTGTADLAGGSFTLNNATGTWVLNGGTFQNGTVNFADAQRLVLTSSCGNRFANLVVNGTLLFDGSAPRVRWNNVAVNGALSVTATGCNPSIAFEGNQTLNVSGGVSVDTSCTMIFEQQAVGTLTIPVGVSIAGGNITFGGANCFGLAMTLVNNGTLDASVAGRTISFNHTLTLTNYDASTGTLTGGTWRVSAPNATFQFTVGGSNPVFNVRTIAPGTAVSIAGNQNATPAFIANLTTINGTFTVANNRRIAITPQGGTLNANGTLTLQNVGRLTVNGNVIFGPLSVFNADISGTAQSGAFSQLAATGTVARAGVFNVTYFQNIPPPNCANVFPLLTSGVTNGLTGSFATTNIPPSPNPLFAVGIVNIPGVGLSLVTSTVADIASTDGQPGRDGLVNNGDFLLFIASFFAGCDLPGQIPCAPADIAQTDASAGADGTVDNGDFLLFVTAFFTGCE